jgi:hypothetical protein
MIRTKMLYSWGAGLECEHTNACYIAVNHLLLAQNRLYLPRGEFGYGPTAAGLNYIRNVLLAANWVP